MAVLFIMCVALLVLVIVFMALLTVADFEYEDESLVPENFSWHPDDVSQACAEVMEMFAPK